MTDSHTTQSKPPLRLGLTLLELACYGLFGVLLLSFHITMAIAGISTLPAFGVGAILLLGGLYALFGTAWFEVRRVRELYGTDAADLRWIPKREPGFVEYLRSLGRNLVHGRMWAALGSFTVSTIIGFIMLVSLQAGIRWTVVSFAPLTDVETVRGPFFIEMNASSAPWLLLGIPVVLAIMLGTAVMHRAVTTAIIGASARESKLHEQVETTSVQREGAVRAADVERTRIERDLHDGVQPRLVSVGMTLGLAHQQIDQDPEKAKELVSEAHTSTKAAITELRQLTRGIYASVLEDRGLDAALSSVASRSHIPVQLDVRLPGRLDRTVEQAMYFAIAEAITNAAKHSRASQCRVIVRARKDADTDHDADTRLWARIEDNGVGGAKVLPGGGLDGISNRVLGAGGTLTLDSPHGGPTTLEVSLPCAS